MKRNANTTTAAEKAAVAQHTTTERKSAERSTHMKRNTSAKAATATVDVIDTAWKFTPNSVTLFGHVFAVSRYAVAKDESVYVNATVEGVGQRLHIGKGSPVYHEAVMAAVAWKAEKPADKPAPVAHEAEPAPVAKPTAKAEKPAKAKAAKPADKPAPVAHKAEPAPVKKPAKAKAEKPAEKPAVPADNAWIGTTIEGKGWRIAFDEAAQRTRVIMDAEPSAKQKAAIDAAGFYWSNTTKSWNKKLTRKAWRAAQALAETLNALK